MEKLLEAISEIQKNHEKRRALTGEDFNIYKVAHIDTDEVKVCRVICALIDPNGAHHQGTVFLKMFVEDVLHESLSENELSGVRVYREYRLPESDRRIDIVLKAEHRFIPIEAKVYAGDQERQCKDYYEFAKRFETEPILYYLTLDGKEPSDYSKVDIPVINKKKGGAASGIRTISFSEEILGWLEKCTAYCHTHKLWPIYEAIRQFDASIRELTGKSEDKEGMDIREKIMGSPEFMKAAAAISNNFMEAKTELVTKVLKELETRIDKSFRDAHGLDVTDKTERFFHYSNTIWKPSNESYPGISYKCVSKNLLDGLDLWLRIEVDHCLYVGFIVYDSSRTENHDFGDLVSVSDLSKETTDKLQGLFKEKTYSDSKEFITWEYLRLRAGKNDRMDFWNLNDDAAALCDKNNFDSEIDAMLKQIGDFMNRSFTE